MASTELVPSRHAEIDIAAARERLPELVEAGDSEELANIAHVAELLRLHEKAQGHAEKANEAARLMVEAEAGIGVIDIRTSLRWSIREPLQIGARTVAAGTRDRYRVLGYADLQGILDGALTVLAEDGITASRALKEVRTLGAGFWDPAPIREAVSEARDRGESLASILRRAGLSRTQATELWRCRTFSYEKGLAIARALGLDETDLRPLKRMRSLLSQEERHRRRHASKARYEERKRLAEWKARDDRMRAKGGKASDMYSLARRAEQMAAGARDELQKHAAIAELNSAVIDLMEAAVKLDRAAAIG